MDTSNIRKMEEELFTPALQEAAQKAKDQGYGKDETLLAAGNAYVNMLVPFTGGTQGALNFLREQVKFLEDQV